MKAELIDKIHLGDTYVLITTSSEFPHSLFSSQHLVTFTGGRQKSFAEAFCAMINDQELHKSLPAIKILQSIE